MINLKEFSKKELAVIGVVIILMICNLLLLVSRFIQPAQQEQQSQTNYSQAKTQEKKVENEVKIPQTEEDIIKKLSQLGERDRMEYYCGEYFRLIEKKKYEEAYNLLYPEFKQNYFPTLDEYVEYIKKEYSASFALEYEDITRQGDIYVLKLNVLDLIGGKENEKPQRIVIKENYYDDFVISFQVAQNAENTALNNNSDNVEE